MSTPWHIYPGEYVGKDAAVLYGQARHDGPSDRDQAVAFANDPGLARELARRWDLLIAVDREHSRSHYNSDGIRLCGWGDTGQGCGLPYPCPTRKILDSR